MNHSERLTKLNLTLPPAPKAMGVYKPVVFVEKYAYFSGHGPLKADKSLTLGRLGDDLDEAAGYQAAKETGLAILASIQEFCGGIDNIKRIIKTNGMVQVTPDFTALPAVINGCSDLFRDVFGEEHGVGARAAVGMASLPAGMCVEIEAMFELHKPV